MNHYQVILLYQDSCGELMLLDEDTSGALLLILHT